MGIDEYHPYGSHWWTNEDCPSAYKYSDLNSLYSQEYFESEAHPGEEQAKELYKYMQAVYKDNFHKEFELVLEIGGGSGQLSKQFDNNGVWCLTLEGTLAGYKKLLNVGIPSRGIRYIDIRKINDLNYYSGFNFDIVVCTEVAEHIEPWFASKIVELCVNSSDVVWFSAADKNRPSHYHHPNEAPIWAWDNIFDFFGFRYIELDGRYDRADRLYVKN